MTSRGTGEGGAATPAYARFLPRLRALFIDAIVIMVAVFAAVSIAVVVRSDHLARPLGFSVAAAWLLYEPVLVAFAGGTIGHRRCNLRIVDDRTGANVSFLKAVLRTLIKAALGWVSFVSMLTTRRSHIASHFDRLGPNGVYRAPANRSPKPIDSGQDRASVTVGGAGGAGCEQQMSQIGPCLSQMGPINASRRPRLAACPSLRGTTPSKGAPMSRSKSFAIALALLVSAAFSTGCTRSDATGPSEQAPEVRLMSSGRRQLSSALAGARGRSRPQNRRGIRPADCCLHLRKDHTSASADWRVDDEPGLGALRV